MQCRFVEVLRVIVYFPLEGESSPFADVFVMKYFSVPNLNKQIKITRGIISLEMFCSGSVDK